MQESSFGFEDFDKGKCNTRENVDYCDSCSVSREYCASIGAGGTVTCARVEEGEQWAESAPRMIILETTVPEDSYFLKGNTLFVIIQVHFLKRFLRLFLPYYFSMVFNVNCHERRAKGRSETEEIAKRAITSFTWLVTRITVKDFHVSECY